VFARAGQEVGSVALILHSYIDLALGILLLSMAVEAMSPPSWLLVLFSSGVPHAHASVSISTSSHWTFSLLLHVRTAEFKVAHCAGIIVPSISGSRPFQRRTEKSQWWTTPLQQPKNYAMGTKNRTSLGHHRSPIDAH